MTITIDLPDKLAYRLVALPEGERDRFAISAIEDALTAKEREADARLAAALLAELDPENEPEREAAECIAAVEEGLDDVDAGRNLLSFEEVRRQWDAETEAYRKRHRAMSDQNPKSDEEASCKSGVCAHFLRVLRAKGNILCIQASRAYIETVAWS